MHKVFGVSENKKFIAQGATKSSINERIYGNKIFSITEILDEYCAHTNRLKYNNISVGIRKSDYLRFIFSENCVKNNFRCAICGTKASHFRIKHDKSSNHYYLHLYGFVKHNSITKYVIFNRDHIIPKSLGGPNTLDNYQLTCAVCNSYRGNMSCDSIDAKHRIIELSTEQLENEKRKNKKTIQNKIQKFLNKARASNSQNDGVFFKFFRQYILENEDDIINYIATNNNFLI